MKTVLVVRQQLLPATDVVYDRCIVVKEQVSCLPDVPTAHRGRRYPGYKADLEQPEVWVVGVRKKCQRVVMTGVGNRCQRVVMVGVRKQCQGVVGMRRATRHH